MKYKKCFYNKLVLSLVIENRQTIKKKIVSVLYIIPCYYLKMILNFEQKMYTH